MGLPWALLGLLGIDPLLLVCSELCRCPARASSDRVSLMGHSFHQRCQCQTLFTALRRMWRDSSILWIRSSLLLPPRLGYDEPSRPHCTDSIRSEPQPVPVKPLGLAATTPRRISRPPTSLATLRSHGAIPSPSSSPVHHIFPPAPPKKGHAAKTVCLLADAGGLAGPWLRIPRSTAGPCFAYPSSTTSRYGPLPRSC